MTTLMPQVQPDTKTTEAVRKHLADCLSHPLLPTIPTSYLYDINARDVDFIQQQEIIAAFGARYQMKDGQLYAGAELFANITRMDEYYTNRDELELIHNYHQRMMSSAPNTGSKLIVTELGPGTGDKSALIAQSLDVQFHYQSVDISDEFLNLTESKIHDIANCRQTLTLKTDFFDFDGIQSAGFKKADMLLMMGNTLGNFPPEQVKVLMNFVSTSLIHPDGQLIIGLDSNHSEESLQNAYDDPHCHTSTFALNALVGMQNDMGVQLNLADYDYKAVFDQQQEMMQMGLVLTNDSEIKFDEENSISFKKDDFIEVGRSYKYSRQTLCNIMKENNFELADCVSSKNGTCIYKFVQGGMQCNQ